MKRRDIFTLLGLVPPALALPPAPPAAAAPEVITLARVRGVIQRIEIVVTCNANPARVAKRVLDHLREKGLTT